MLKLSSQSRDNRPRKKHPLSRFFEFKGINRLSIGQYRTRIRSLYDGPAGAVLALGSMISLHEPLVGHLLRSRKFDVTEHDLILDVGSGAGQILRHLLRRTQSSAQLVAFDLSHQMLRRARKKLKSHRPAYVAGDMARMPFAEDSFDCVTCGWVIEHLPDPRPGLKEVGRVLKPGGRALILATEDTVLGSLVSRTWKCRTYNRKELEQACLECGVPWKSQLWFTKAHQFFKMGGILVEAVKTESGDEEIPLAPTSEIAI